MKNILIILAFALLLAAPTLAQKTDTIKVINGNIITGEIKALEYGLLTFKTDDIGTLRVKWNKVLQIISDKSFEIELENGMLLFGIFTRSDENYKTRFVSGPAVNEIDLINIISVTPIKQRFWARFDGSFDIGVSYAKANELGQLNFGSDFKYKAKKIRNDLSYSGAFTSQKDKDPTRRQDFSYNFYYALKRKWDVGLLTSFQQNSELGIFARILVGGGFAKSMIQSNRNTLQSSIALVSNTEWSDDKKRSSNNIEGLLALSYYRFKYDSPKIDINSGINLYPSITEFGRLRTEFDTRLSIELFEDFFWKLSVYFSYDTEPPDAAASKSDYGFTLSFGYTL